MRRNVLRRLVIGVTLMPVLAQAADIGRPAAYPQPVPAAFVGPTWTGFYAGVQGGYGTGDSSGTQNAGGSFFPVVPYRIDPHGFLGGGHVGYNYQVGRWVLGVEGDVEAADVKALTSVSTAGQNYFFNVKADMLASARARAGFAQNNWLLYATGGVAFGDVSTPPLDTLNGMRTGWTLGAGFQYAFNPAWSARLEYRYTDLGTKSASGGEPGSTDDNAFSFHAVRIGLSYKLGGF
jgi:outer membrane immunogenic protein